MEIFQVLRRVLPYKEVCETLAPDVYNQFESGVRREISSVHSHKQLPQKVTGMINIYTEIDI